MNKTGQPTLTIVIHESGNAMSLTQDGRITRVRSGKPSGFWSSVTPRTEPSTLSLSSCQIKYTVLNECIRL